MAFPRKTYTFNLEPNAKWHDGKPLTSDDVLYTVRGYEHFAPIMWLEPRRWVSRVTT
ncbi:MAG: ABC transporter substrate-binding protein [Xenophilus sp.]